MDRVLFRSSGNWLAALACLLLLLPGCSTLRPGFETPSVSITSFRPLSSGALAPKFEIGLRVVNPNASLLKLRGMAYRIYLNDYEVIDGAANDLPVVPAYGEAEFTVAASVGLVEGVRFVNDLLHQQDGKVDYRVRTKLDVGALLPTILIEKTGVLTPGD